MLAAGVLIDERHEIEQLLGRGGMAEVFRARDITTGRSVAIKLLRAVDPQSMGRFRTEIEVLCRLDHPGVVRLCGTGSHDGVPYLVLELVDGPSLADVLDSGPLGVEQSISIGQQLAEALTHAHGLNIVHRGYGVVMAPSNAATAPGLSAVRPPPRSVDQADPKDPARRLVDTGHRRRSRRSRDQLRRRSSGARRAMSAPSS